MLLTVTRVAYDGGTIATGYGEDADGRQWGFAGDWRPMQTVAEALDAGETVEVEVESWQLL